jgi:uncharacterized lipoprotein YddW (UPF0748 family)
MGNLKVTASSWFKRYTAQSANLSSQDKVAVSNGDTFDVDHAFKVGNHLFVELLQPLGSVGKVGYFFADHVDVEIDELRGVWLTNVASDVLFSRANIKSALNILKTLKFNTLYPVVWNGNYTLYESSVANSAFGKAIHPDFKNRDIIQEILDLARDQGFRVIPWFEYGLMTLPNSELVNLHPEWFTRDERGSFTRLRKNNEGRLVEDEHIWLNPCRSEVIQFMSDLIGEFIQKYPSVHGIQLDDHFGMPKEMGYDVFTTNLYRQDTGSRRVPKNESQADWSEWVDWRVGKVTGLMRTISTTVKSINKDYLVSLSPNPQDFSRRNYMANWTAWEKERLIDELIVQVYRENTQSLEDEITRRAVLEARDRILTGIGLFTGYRNNPRSLNLIKDQSQVVRDINFAGVSYFFYETLVKELNTEVPPTLVARDLSTFSFLA